MVRVARIVGSCLLLVALGACAASTPPAAPPQEAAKAEPAPKTEIVYIESVPMTEANAQALYAMVKSWQADPVFMEKGFETDPYLAWLNSLNPHISCKPGPNCPEEDKEFLRRLSLLSLFYRSDMFGGEPLIEDMEMQIERMLNLWGHNPEYMIPEGAKKQ